MCVSGPNPGFESFSEFRRRPKLTILAEGVIPAESRFVNHWERERERKTFFFDFKRERKERTRENYNSPQPNPPLSPVELQSALCHPLAEQDQLFDLKTKTRLCGQVKGQQEREGKKSHLWLITIETEAKPIHSIAICVSSAFLNCVRFHSLHSLDTLDPILYEVDPFLTVREEQVPPSWTQPGRLAIFISYK